ncbi:cyclin-C [Onychomys torridus]|uniref:cyclin-C n=1 Tax=Onychomys torridus TaxID=38674 RepID=UPI00167F9DF1|nr:cyclin-C [Onychomys torridus]
MLPVPPRSEFHARPKEFRVSERLEAEGIRRSPVRLNCCWGPLWSTGVCCRASGDSKQLGVQALPRTRSLGGIIRRWSCYREFGVVSNTRLIAATTSVLKTRFSYAFPKEFPYRMNHILECEFYLLELMDCCLIVYHPYRPLLQYVQDMGQEDVLLPLAWRIVNDTYRTDLCLLYPPFMIALACLHVACVVQQKDARQWFAELSVDMEKILEIIRVILKLYEQWKNFDERKEMATILSKMPKPKPPPNRSSLSDSPLMAGPEAAR